MENQKGITDKNIKQIDEKEVKSKNKQNYISFFQKKAHGFEVVKNIMLSFVTQNSKLYNLNI